MVMNYILFAHTQLLLDDRHRNQVSLPGTAGGHCDYV